MILIDGSPVWPDLLSLSLPSAYRTPLVSLVVLKQ